MQKEITFLIPAHNEEKTIAFVLKKINKFIRNNKIDAEVLVVDNNSSDKTKKIALKHGARVVFCEKKGYGNALIFGINNSYGKVIIMADADDSYDFLEAQKFIDPLLEYDLVIGNRFTKNMEKGSMKFTHKYIGTPFLTLLTNLKYKTNIKDINCGFRSFRTDKIKKLKLECEGMEFASEMIIKAKLNKYKIKEVDIAFYKDKRNCGSNLNTIKDGIRHLKFILFGIK